MQKLKKDCQVLIASKRAAETLAYPGHSHRRNSSGRGVLMFYLSKVARVQCENTLLQVKILW